MYFRVFSAISLIYSPPDKPSKYEQFANNGIEKRNPKIMGRFMEKDLLLVLMM
jgi:hypothetical protein